MVVKLIPVCECGHIFHEGIVCKLEQYQQGPITFCEHFFDPAVCPECGERITAIEYGSSYVTDR